MNIRGIAAPPGFRSGLGRLGVRHGCPNPEMLGSMKLAKPAKPKLGRPATGHDPLISARIPAQLRDRLALNVVG